MDSKKKIVIAAAVTAGVVVAGIVVNAIRNAAYVGRRELRFDDM